MAIDWTAMVIDPVFDRLGREATVINPLTSASITITVLDAADGVQLGEFMPVSSAKPALTVRQSELDTYGFLASDLIDSNCTYNGTTYRIRDATGNPAPGLGTNAVVNLIIVEP